jgi:hypothetical protein
MAENLFLFYDQILNLYDRKEPIYEICERCRNVTYLFRIFMVQCR